MRPPGRQQPSTGYLGLLRSREYVGLLVSRVISLVGDQLARVALTVLVFERTGSPLLTALTYAATFLPVVVAGPLLGGLADRFPRRRLLITADLLRAVIFALMALPGVPLSLLLAMVLFASTVEAPWAAARAPLLRDILQDEDGYLRGSGLDETLDASGQIVGFAAAGLLLVVFTPTAALLLDALSFLFSALVVRLLVQHRAAADASGERRPGTVSRVRRSLGDAKVGIGAALSGPVRRPVLLTWGGISCAIAPEALAAPWAASLGAGPAGTGLLFAAGPLGAVVGLLLVGRLSAARAQRLMVPMAVLTVAPLVACFLDPPFAVALGLVAVSGVGSAYSLLARVAFVRGTAPAVRGRAFSVAASGVTAGQGVGIALAGLAASLLGPASAVGLSGLLGLVLVVAATLSTSSEPLAARLVDPVLVPDQPDPDRVEQILRIEVLAAGRQPAQDDVRPAPE